MAVPTAAEVAILPNDIREVCSDLRDTVLTLTSSPVEFRNEGVSQGSANAIDVVGGAIAVAVAGGVATITQAAQGFAFISFGHSGGAAVGTRYVPPFAYSAVSSTEAQFQWACPRAGTLQNLRAHALTLPTGTFTCTYTVRVADPGGAAAANTTMTLQYGAATSKDLADLVNTFVIAAGQLISISVVGAGSGGASAEVFLSMELV